jgi:hypothetical protein
MKIASTAEIEDLLGLPPLQLKMEAETQAQICRLTCNEWKPKYMWYGHARKARDMMKDPILQMGTDKMTETCIP